MNSGGEKAISYTLKPARNPQISFFNKKNGNFSRSRIACLRNIFPPLNYSIYVYSIKIDALYFGVISYQNDGFNIMNAV